MHHGVRQRAIVRVCILAGCLVLLGMWLFSPAPVDADDACADDENCYDMLVSSAQQQEMPINAVPPDANDAADAAVNTALQSDESNAIAVPTYERVKGAFVVLVRNNELYAMRSSMQYLEDRFNRKFNYPWIFLNDEPFTDEFKELTSAMTNAEVHYGEIPKEHWGYPEWINTTHATACRKDMGRRGIVYGGSESYRHMCRFQSGFFYLHPLLDNLEYYWRVEPGVKFNCEMDYDPFKVMKDRNLKYGFTMALRELADTIPTLWATTVEFAKKYPQYIYPRTRADSMFSFVSEDKGKSYNLCHFWSNFEIASMAFLRSPGYMAYFDFLDKKGGFFYERWGDAPVHSLAASLMLKADEMHWFYDIGYRHDIFEHCPTEPHWLTYGKCYCDPGQSFVLNGGSCTNRFLEVTGKTVHDFIVTQNDLPVA